MEFNLQDTCGQGDWKTYIAVTITTRLLRGVNADRDARRGVALLRPLRE